MTPPLHPNFRIVGGPDAEPGQDVVLAMACLRLAGGHAVGDRAMRSALASAPFRGLFKSILDTAPAGRGAWIAAWLQREADRNPDHARIASAIDLAMPDVEAEPDDPEAAEPEGFDLGLIDNPTFFSREHRLDWLARGILVAGEACVLGGPSKALKTSVLVDLAISLASGTPFLGRFEVGEPVPLMVISGESGPKVLQANARQVCIARGLPFDQAGRIAWGFKIPQLSNAAHLDAIRRAIDLNRSRVVAIDPLYLALLAGSSHVDAGNMYQMGPLLADVASACLECGATPILAHHARKHRENPFEPMELDDLAFAGIGQFARQWMLLSRREKYEPDTGMHRMNFVYGGSAGHGGQLHLDINTGRIGEDFEGRVWGVESRLPSESQAEAKAKRETEAKAEGERKKTAKDRDKKAEAERKLNENTLKCLEAIRSLTSEEVPQPATAKRVRTRAALSGEMASPALDRLIRNKDVEVYSAKVPNGKSFRDVDAYRVPQPKPLATWEGTP